MKKFKDIVLEALDNEIASGETEASKDLAKMRVLLADDPSGGMFAAALHVAAIASLDPKAAGLLAALASQYFPVVQDIVGQQEEKVAS